MTNTSEEANEPLVRFHEDEPFTYHYCPFGNSESVCGIALTGKDYQRFSDPGDLLEPCDQCRHFRPDVTNHEIVEWIADVVGFEMSDRSPASYLTKEQLSAIRDWIKEHEEVD